MERIILPLPTSLCIRCYLSARCPGGDDRCAPSFTEVDVGKDISLLAHIALGGCPACSLLPYFLFSQHALDAGSHSPQVPRNRLRAALLVKLGLSPTAGPAV